MFTVLSNTSTKPLKSLQLIRLVKSSNENVATKKK